VRGTRKNGKNGVPLPLQFIANWEQRILKQEELIAELKQNGRSTKRAEGVLRNQLRALAMLRNHSDLSLELSKPNAYEKLPGDPSVQRGTSARNRNG
jgi:hypothetical protein